MLYLDIVYHIFLIITILGGVFVFWGSSLEKSIVNQTIIDLIKEKLQYFTISQDIQRKLIETSVPSQCYGHRNIILFLILLCIFIVTLVITIVITGIAYNISPSKQVTTTIIKNIVIFVFVAIFELVFFALVVIEYVPITEKEINDILMNTLHSSLSKST